jgi:radical SAM protein with 4Fe4S-binding SPASM domain
MMFPPPRYIQLYPTTRCNQRCYFCFNPDNKSFPDLSFDNSLKLLDVLFRLGIGEIDIMGGEPLLLPWMPDFVKFAARNGMTVNISTNGSAVEVVKKFDETFPDHVQIGISLEGSTEERHNLITNSSNFRRAVKSIKNYISMNRYPIVKTVVTKRTMVDVPKIVNLLRDIGVQRYYLIHMDVMSHNRSLLKEALRYTDFMKFHENLRTRNKDIEIFKVNASCFDIGSIPDIRCAGGVRKLAILPDGTVFPCNLFLGIDEFELGNIFEDDFSKIWMNRRLEFFRKGGTNRCSFRNCMNRTHCTGGCPAHAYFHHGHVNATDVRCVMQPADG